MQRPVLVMTINLITVVFDRDGLGAGSSLLFGSDRA